MLGGNKTSKKKNNKRRKGEIRRKIVCAGKNIK